MLRVAQAAQVCTATSSGSLSHCSVLNLVCSGLQAEIEFGKVGFPLRVWWYYPIKLNLSLHLNWLDGLRVLTPQISRFNFGSISLSITPPQPQARSFPLKLNHEHAPDMFSCLRDLGLSSLWHGQDRITTTSLLPVLYTRVSAPSCAFISF